MILTGGYKIIAIQRFLDLLVDRFQFLAMALLLPSGGGGFNQRLYFRRVGIEGFGFLENMERGCESAGRNFLARGFDQAIHLRPARALLPFAMDNPEQSFRLKIVGGKFKSFLQHSLGDVQVSFLVRRLGAVEKISATLRRAL